MSDTHTPKLTSGQIHWINIIKIVSAFLVVMQHSISSAWSTLSPDTPSWFFINFVFILSRSAVPLFFMCSGAGMLQREHTIKEILHKNIFQLLKVYLSWMLIYGACSAVSLIQEGLGTPRTIFNAFVKKLIFGEYHTWFVLALISLYLITPFLYKITQDAALLKYFLILSVLFTIVLPLTGYFGFLDRLTATFSNFNMHFVVGYVLYYVLGYYISQLNWQKMYSRITILLFVVSYVSAFLLSSMYSVSTQTAHQEMYGEFTPLGFLFTITLFGLIRILFANSSSNLVAKKLLSYGIAIYLMHPLFLEFIAPLNGLTKIIGAILIYLVCLFISFLIDKTKFASKYLLK